MSCEYACNKNYINNKINDEIFAFDIKVTYNDSTIKKYKYVSTDITGELFNSENNIKKLKIVLYCINSNETIILRKYFNDCINESIALYKNNVIISINKALNSTELNINYLIIINNI